MNELALAGLVAVFESRNTIGHGDAFHGHDAVGANGQCSAGHDFEALPAVESARRIARHLLPLDGERASTVAIIGKRERDTVHHDAIEWRLVTFGDDRLSQHAPRRLCGLDGCHRKVRHRRETPVQRLRRGEHGLALLAGDRPMADVAAWHVAKLFDAPEAAPPEAIDAMSTFTRMSCGR